MGDEEPAQPVVGDEEMADPPPPLPASPVATKRRYYDASGQEITDVKRNRPKPVEGEKHAALSCVLHWTADCVAKFQIADTTNIDTMNELASILNTAHHLHRQLANKKGGLDTKVPLAHEFQIGTRKITRENLFPRLKSIANLYGFTYGTSDAEKKLLGTLSSILSLLVAFKSRLAEVRTSVLDIVFGKENGDIKARKLDQFFLEDGHAMLLSGMNLAPAVKSSQKACLGPIAIALQLAFTTEKKYQKTWKDTFVHAFKLFPGASDFAELLAGSQFDNCTIIRELADIALWGTTRTSTKMYPPLALLYTAASENALFKANALGAMLQATPTAIAANNLSSAIFHLDFSGRGAFHFWNQLAGKTFRMKKGKLTERTANELLLHATFGTHKEDLSLVEFMTGHQFQTRKQIGDQLQERGASTEAIAVAIIPFKKVGKLANAAQTDLLTGARGQLVRSSTFSVKCKQTVNVEGALYKTLLRGPSGSVNASKTDQASLLARLANIKSSIQKRIEKEKEIKWGTVSMYTYDAAAIATGYGPECTDVPVLKGEYFYGIPDLTV
jgi:hypothetical protein